MLLRHGYLMIAILEIERDHPVAPPSQALQHAQRLVLARLRLAVGVGGPKVDHHPPLLWLARRRLLGNQVHPTDMGELVGRSRLPCAGAETASHLLLEELALLRGKIVGARQRDSQVVRRWRAVDPLAPRSFAQPLQHLRRCPGSLPSWQPAAKPHVQRLDGAGRRWRGRRRRGLWF